MLVCVFLCKFAHETAGAARIRLSLRPLIGEGESFMHDSGASRCGNAESHHDVIARSASDEAIHFYFVLTMDCFACARNDGLKTACVLAV